MNLVKYYELHVANQVGALVQHAAKDFCRHHETIRLRVNLHIAGENTNGGRRERLLEITELLVRESFNRRRVNCPASVRKSVQSCQEIHPLNPPRHMFSSERNRVFSDHRLAC